MDLIFLIELLLFAGVLFILVKTLLESIKVVFYVLLVMLLLVFFFGISYTEMIKWIEQVLLWVL